MTATEEMIVPDVPETRWTGARLRAGTAIEKTANDGRKAVEGFGQLISLFVDSVTLTTEAIVTRQFAWWEFLTQARFMITVALLPTVFIAIPFGLVLVIEIGGLATQIGAVSIVGGVVSVGIVREASPIIAGIILAGAGGSAICADLGSRTIRDEIDALEVMGIDPVPRLVGPRILATMVISVLLNGVVSFVGITSGYLADVYILHATAGGFLTSLSAFAQTADVFESILKSAMFGVIAAVVACYEGLHTQKGPAGVGEAVNRSVVVTGVALFLVNLVLTEVFLVTFPQKVL
jgi:phospholipid/cholesterol/gamma-HCH transport system permease protein